jgi:cytochrome bd-type quinol oxidase subunit 1
MPSHLVARAFPVAECLRIWLHAHSVGTPLADVAKVLGWVGRECGRQTRRLGGRHWTFASEVPTVLCLTIFLGTPNLSHLRLHDS